MKILTNIQTWLRNRRARDVNDEAFLSEANNMMGEVRREPYNFVVDGRHAPTLSWLFLFTANLMATYVPSLLYLLLDSISLRAYVYSPVILPMLFSWSDNDALGVALIGALLTFVALLSYATRRAPFRWIIPFVLALVFLFEALAAIRILSMFKGLGHS